MGIDFGNEGFPVWHPAFREVGFGMGVNVTRVWEISKPYAVKPFNTLNLRARRIASTGNAPN